MLFEAISNVLQHAHASEMRLQAHVDQGDVVVRVVDNGRGFDAQGEPRNGLSSLRQRAEAIGAGLAVSSEPGRTAVEIRLR
jgi:signal transduction histidine kinase